jgi:hypothetical protein
MLGGTSPWPTTVSLNPNVTAQLGPQPPAKGREQTVGHKPGSAPSGQPLRLRCCPALVAQGIERRPPEAKAQVRFLPRAPPNRYANRFVADHHAVTKVSLLRNAYKFARPGTEMGTRKEVLQTALARVGYYLHDYFFAGLGVPFDRVVFHLAPLVVLHDLAGKRHFDANFESLHKC